MDWEEPDADDLGPQPIDKFIRLDWWALEAARPDIDLTSPASAVLPVEPAKPYGVAIETRCFLQSIEPQRYVPSPLEVRMHLELIGEAEGPNSILLGPTSVFQVAHFLSRQAAHSHRLSLLGGPSGAWDLL